jgi:hypothetical protein
MANETQSKHGGARPGAGAKPKRGVRKVPTSIGVSPEVKAYLDQAEPSGSEAVEDAVRISKKFKEWRKVKGIKVTITGDLISNSQQNPEN